MRVQEDGIRLENGPPAAGEAQGRSERARAVSFRDIAVILAKGETAQTELEVICLIKSDDPAALPTVNTFILVVSPDWISQQPKPFRDLIQPATTNPSTRIDIIINTKAGPDSSRIDAFITQILDPLFERTSTAYTIQRTQGVGDAGRIGREIMQAKKQATIAVLGGDGTTHELLNGVLLDEAKRAKMQLDLVLLSVVTLRVQSSTE